MPKIFFKTLATLAISLALFSPITQASPPSNADAVMNHLEFEGYRVSMDRKHIKALHDQELNIYLKKYFGGILVTAYFTTNSKGKKHRDKLLNIVNKLNAKSAATRFYLDSDTDIVLEGYYPGKYNKASFATFLKTFNRCRTDVSDISDQITPYLE